MLLLQVKLIDQAGKAKLRMQVAESALSDAQASYQAGTLRWRVNIDVLRTAIEEVEAELYRAIFTLAKHGIAVQSAQQRLQQICLLTGQTLTQWACPKGAAYGIF